MRMANSPAANMAEIFQKINRLATQRDDAIARCARLEDKIADLQAELKDTGKRLEKALLDVEFLTVSHRLADTPEALADTRKLIEGLIRKVDSAIRLVKNDPADA